MPLLLTPAQPLPTTAGLPVSQFYGIINTFSYSRLLRQVEFTFGYYVSDAASLPSSGLGTLPLNLPTGFSFQMSAEQAAAASDPQAIMEAYAAHVLGEQLPGATIQTVS